MASNLFKPSMPEDFFSTNIENVCRICLQTSITLSSIFRDEIDEMISEFLPKKVDMRDNFPHQICRKCLEDVKVAYAFKKQAEYSHEVIKNMLVGKRLPRSSNKKSYQEINENNIFRTQSIASDPMFSEKFICHICQKPLAHKNVLKKHLQRVHKFFDFGVYGDLFANSKTPFRRDYQNESFEEEMTFPILPQVIMVDDENDMEVDDDERAEAKDDPFKSHSDITNTSLNKSAKTSTPSTNNQQQNTYDCHICNKRLTRRYYLKCHLERVHKFFNTANSKTKAITSKNSTVKSSQSEKVEKQPHFSAPSSSSLQLSNSEDDAPGIYECRICKKVLTRRYGLKKHYELVHNIIDNEKPIDLTYDGSSDDHENNLAVMPNISTPSLTPVKRKSDSIPNSSNSRKKTINVYICHICEKEFSGRATMRRHLKNVHKFRNFEDEIWLSKVYQKFEENDDEEDDIEHMDDNDNEFDQSYKQDEDIDMHAYLLCPEVLLSTVDENNATGIKNPAEKSDAVLPDNIKSSASNGDNGNASPSKVEPIKLKLNTVSAENTDQSQKKRAPYIHKCEFCNKLFNRVDHLRRHESTHTKPFKCQFCSKGFYRRDLLVRHERAAHAKRLYRQQLERQLKQTKLGTGLNSTPGTTDAKSELDDQRPHNLDIGSSLGNENSMDNKDPMDEHDFDDDNDHDEDDDDDDEDDIDDEDDEDDDENENDKSIYDKDENSMDENESSNDVAEKKNSGKEVKSEKSIKSENEQKNSMDENSTSMDDNSNVKTDKLKADKSINETENKPYTPEINKEIPIDEQNDEKSSKYPEDKYLDVKSSEFESQKTNANLKLEDCSANNNRQQTNHHEDKSQQNDDFSAETNQKLTDHHAPKSQNYGSQHAPISLKYDDYHAATSQKHGEHHPKTSQKYNDDQQAATSQNNSEHHASTNQKYNDQPAATSQIYATGQTAPSQTYDANQAATSQKFDDHHTATTQKYGEHRAAPQTYAEQHKSPSQTYDKYHGVTSQKYDEQRQTNMNLKFSDVHDQQHRNQPYDFPEEANTMKFDQGITNSKQFDQMANRQNYVQQPDANKQHSVLNTAGNKQYDYPELHKQDRANYLPNQSTSNQGSSLTGINMTVPVVGNADINPSNHPEENVNSKFESKKPNVSSTAPENISSAENPTNQQSSNSNMADLYNMFIF